MSDANRDVTVRTNLVLGNVQTPDFRAILQPLQDQVDGIGLTITSTINETNRLQQAMLTTISQATQATSTITQTVTGVTSASRGAAGAINNVGNSATRMGGAASSAIGGVVTTLNELLHYLDKAKNDFVKSSDKAEEFYDVKQKAIALYEREAAAAEKAGLVMTETVDDFLTRKQNQFDAYKYTQELIKEEVELLVKQGATVKELEGPFKRLAQSKIALGELRPGEAAEELQKAGKAAKDTASQMEMASDMASRLGNRIGNMRTGALFSAATGATRFAMSMGQVVAGGEDLEKFVQIFGSLQGAINGLQSVDVTFSSMEKGLDRLQIAADRAQKMLKSGKPMSDEVKASLEASVRAGDAAQQWATKLSSVKGVAIGLGVAIGALYVAWNVGSAIEQHMLDISLEKLRRKTEGTRELLQIEVERHGAQAAYNALSQKELDIRMEIAESLKKEASERLKLSEEQSQVALQQAENEGRAALAARADKAVEEAAAAKAAVEQSNPSLFSGQNLINTGRGLVDFATDVATFGNGSDYHGIAERDQEAKRRKLLEEESRTRMTSSALRKAQDQYNDDDYVGLGQTISQAPASARKELTELLSKPLEDARKAMSSRSAVAERTVQEEERRQKEFADKRLTEDKKVESADAGKLALEAYDRAQLEKGGQKINVEAEGIKDARTGQSFINNSRGFIEEQYRTQIEASLAKGDFQGAKDTAKSAVRDASESDEERSERDVLLESIRADKEKSQNALKEAKEAIASTTQALTEIADALALMNKRGRE